LAGLNGSVPAAELLAVEYPWVSVTGPVVGVALNADVTEFAILKFCTVSATLLLLTLKLGSPV
jgi:hypothetical protein